MLLWNCHDYDDQQKLPFLFTRLLYCQFLDVMKISTQNTDFFVWTKKYVLYLLISFEQI